MTRLKLDVFGRSVLVERDDDAWVVFYLSGDGKRRRADDIFIPGTVAESEVERWVADLCHEMGHAAEPERRAHSVK